MQCQSNFFSRLDSKTENSKNDDKPFSSDELEKKEGYHLIDLVESFSMMPISYFDPSYLESYDRFLGYKNL